MTEQVYSYLDRGQPQADDMYLYDYLIAEMFRARRFGNAGSLWILVTYIENVLDIQLIDFINLHNTSPALAADYDRTITRLLNQAPRNLQLTYEPHDVRYPPFDYTQELTAGQQITTNISGYDILNLDTAATDDCCMCLEPLEIGQTIGVITGCGHQFHDPCIRTYITEYNRHECPLCRHTIGFGGGPFIRYFKYLG